MGDGREDKSYWESKGEGERKAQEEDRRDGRVRVREGESV
jgi:hypothetical protein